MPPHEYVVWPGRVDHAANSKHTICSMDLCVLLQLASAGRDQPSSLSTESPLSVLKGDDNFLAPSGAHFHACEPEANFVVLKPTPAAAAAAARAQFQLQTLLHTGFKYRLYGAK